jgi:hypothetical protein
MLTFFSTPKPFRGHIATIQRNAIRSWTLLDPGAEVILFGNEDGAAETARELGIRHEPNVERNENGTKYLRSIFDRAQELARHNLLCYVNCDILLMADFREALERVTRHHRAFLMVGRRWDTNIVAPWDFTLADWQQQLHALALREGRQRPSQWIDYFAFSRGLYYRNTPAFVIGRPSWDNWLVWKARASKVAVVDASELVVAVHQNHDYSYHPDGEKGVWEGEEAQSNYRLLGGWRHFGTMENATHRLTPTGFRHNHRHGLVVAGRAAAAARSALWFGLLKATRPVRHALGIRRHHSGAAGA